jgi:hypothetical protein
MRVDSSHPALAMAKNLLAVKVGQVILFGFRARDGIERLRHGRKPEIPLSLRSERPTVALGRKHNPGLPAERGGGLLPELA